MHIETVYIRVDDHPAGKVMINKSDFDPATMVLWVDEPDPPEKRKYERRK